jgi:hypothetical protein
MVRSTLRIVVAVAVILAILWVGLTYQPVRHIIYNNSGVTLQAQQEHFGQIIPAGAEADINWPFDTPLSVSFRAKGIPVSVRVRFGGNGVMQIWAPWMKEPALEFVLPEDWATKRMFWREYKYQFGPDGTIRLLAPSQTPPITDFASQPKGFPIFPTESERSGT